MPTGYTAAIKDGITFPEFVWDCAHAFGALILKRDEPAGTPIPKFKPDDFNKNRLVEVQAQLDRALTFDLKQAALLSAKDYDSNMRSYRERVKEKRDLKKKYQAMLQKVTAWNPPTPHHVELKEYMANQIKESMRFDCCTPAKPVKESAALWLEKHISRLRESVDCHTKGQAEEIQRCNERNSWVQELNKSVPMPRKLKA